VNYIRLVAERYVTYRKRAESLGVNGSLMHKDVFRTVLRDDESETLLDIEPLDGARLGREGSYTGKGGATVSNSNEALS
jgi:hypothetical protein